MIIFISLAVAGFVLLGLGLWLWRSRSARQSRQTASTAAVLAAGVGTRVTRNRMRTDEIRLDEIGSDSAPVAIESLEWVAPRDETEVLTVSRKVKAPCTAELAESEVLRYKPSQNGCFAIEEAELATVEEIVAEPVGESAPPVLAVAEAPETLVTVSTSELIAETAPFEGEGEIAVPALELAFEADADADASGLAESEFLSRMGTEAEAGATEADIVAVAETTMEQPVLAELEADVEARAPRVEMVADIAAETVAEPASMMTDAEAPDSPLVSEIAPPETAADVPVVGDIDTATEPPAVDEPVDALTVADFPETIADLESSVSSAADIAAPISSLAEIVAADDDDNDEPTDSIVSEVRRATLRRAPYRLRKARPVDVNLDTQISELDHRLDDLEALVASIEQSLADIDPLIDDGIDDDQARAA